MSIANPDPCDAEDADVPQLAVAALNAATRRALAAGQTVVMVRDDKLVQVTNGDVVELKPIDFKQRISAADGRRHS